MEENKKDKTKVSAGESDIKNTDNKPEDKKDYEFVTETIKRKPVNKRKVFQRMSASISFGLIAGFVACVTFAYLAPKLYERVNPPAPVDDTRPITIPMDDNTTEEENVDKSEANAANENDKGANVVEVSKGSSIDENNTDSVSEDLTEDDKNSLDKSDSDTDENDENSEDVKDEGETDIEEISLDGNEEDSENPDGENEEGDEEGDKELTAKSLNVEDYKNLFVKFKEINSNTSRSLATVTLVSDNTDWFMNNYETGNKFTGIILADNGRELLIIANLENLSKTNDIEVTFCDGKVYKGKIKKLDPNTGLTVVAVNLNIISEETMESIAMTELGNSSVSSLVGTPVMAIGAPLGIEGSMQLGLITSSSHIMEFPDTNLRYLTTDMYGSTDGSGVIIDLDGRVVGIICHGGASSDSRNLIRAYGISDIKAKIEKISNGQDLAYLGIVGTDVTEEAMEKFDVPMGTYVKQVYVDSPAMRGGIRNGDVIVKFGTTDITNFSDFKEAMLKSQPGDATMITVKRPGRIEYVEFSYEINLEALR